MKNKALAIPHLIWSLVFIVVPICFVLYFAFTDDSGAFTLQWISQIGRFWGVFAHSLKLALISTLICLVIGYPMAYIISRTKWITQRTLIMLIISINYYFHLLTYINKVASPKLKNRYLSLIASSYASSTCSLPASADTNITSVDSGR